MCRHSLLDSRKSSRMSFLCSKWIMFTLALSTTLLVIQYFRVCSPNKAPSTSVTSSRKPSSLLEYVNSLGKQPQLSLQRYTQMNATEEDADFPLDLLDRAKKFLGRSKKTISAPIPAHYINSRTTINLVVVACEKRGRENAITLLKSALLFSQDVHLHVHVFSDSATIPLLSLDLIELKWTSAALGWMFTFTVHPEWFPSESDGPWKGMWAPCSTQRLFVPNLLQDVDAGLYLDTDIIIVSNLTVLWEQLESKMRGDIMVAMAPNNEKSVKGHYGIYSKIPFYEPTGVQAGVVLMNLTRMRDFNIVQRSIAAYQLYHEKLGLADQDIYNIIFHTFRERLFLLDCVYDFTHVHCGEGPKQLCLHHNQPGPVCFCNSTLTEGVRIVHGNGHTFRKDWPFLFQLQSGFQKLNLLVDDPLKTIRNLMIQFENLQEKPACFGLTSQALYGNAVQYLKRLAHS